MQPIWQERILTTEAEGMKPFAVSAVERWFTPDFLKSSPSVADAVKGWIESTPVSGFLGACHAIPKVDTRGTLASLEVPILIVVGSEDPGTPPWMSEALKASAPAASLVKLERLRHLCNLEDPEAFNRTVDDFYTANGIGR
jgi:3-oxoadipate enol-lactonase